MEIIETTMIPLHLLRNNEGQIAGLPDNPRKCTEKQFERLKRSIQEDEGFLKDRELLVYRQGSVYVVIGGNMRLEALRALAWEEAPCKVIPEDATIEKLRAYAIKDNRNYGRWDKEKLNSEDWNAEDLENWGIENVVTDADVPKEVETDDRKVMEFTLSPEQLKFVKQRLNEVDREDNGSALVKILEDYDEEGAQVPL